MLDPEPSTQSVPVAVDTKTWFAVPGELFES